MRNRLRKILSLIVFLCLLPALARAQSWTIVNMGPGLPVASLPAASATSGQLWLVRDGTGSTDCTGGGGSTTVLCISTGSVYTQFTGVGGGGAAAAGTLTGTTLAANVVTSSLTSVGTLANLTVTNPITGSVTGSAATLTTPRTINGTSFNGSANITITADASTLTGTTLNAPVVASSLTSVGTLSSLTLGGQLTMAANAIQFTDITALYGGAANTLDIRNSTSATKTRFFNTFTSSTSYEDLELDWQTVANTVILGTGKGSGGGTARVFQIRLGGNSAVPAFTIGTATSGGVIVSNFGTTGGVTSLGLMDIGNAGTVTATSGTSIGLRLRESWAPSSSSTMIGRELTLEPVVNYAGGGAGSLDYLYIAATETALPTAKSYAVRALGGSAATQHLFSVTITDPHVETGQATAPALAAGCGTGATIVGTDTSGRITTNATAFTSCVITFHTAWTNIPQCFIADETTALSTEKPVPTQTTLTFVGTGIAGGDILSYGCFGRI